MEAYKRMSKSATMALFAAGLVSTGAIASIGVQAFAQTPTDGSSIASHTRGRMDDGDTIVLPQRAITEVQAIAAVLGQYPALAIRHIKLEGENGVVVYSTKLSDGTEVIVDVMTGAVTLETDAAEAAEHQGMGKWHKGGRNDANEEHEAQGVEENDGPKGPTEPSTTTGV